MPIGQCYDDTNYKNERILYHLITTKQFTLARQFLGDAENILTIKDLNMILNNIISATSTVEDEQR